MAGGITLRAEPVSGLLPSSKGSLFYAAYLARKPPPPTEIFGPDEGAANAGLELFISDGLAFTVEGT